MDSIIASDTLLLAAISNLGLEDKGMIDDFEKASSHLLVHDLVVKRKIRLRLLIETNSLMCHRQQRVYVLPRQTKCQKAKLVWNLGSTSAKSL